MRRVVMAMILGISMLALTTSAHADVLRCGERLVDVGATIGEVKLKCGSPTARDRRSETRGSSDHFFTVTIDTWTYNFGPHDFLRTLTFVEGRLRNIEEGDYGM